jgi:hypothetical protein
LYDLLDALDEKVGESKENQPTDDVQSIDATSGPEGRIEKIAHACHPCRAYRYFHIPIEKLYACHSVLLRLPGFGLPERKDALGRGLPRLKHDSIIAYDPSNAIS